MMLFKPCICMQTSKDWAAQLTFYAFTKLCIMSWYALKVRMCRAWLRLSSPTVHLHSASYFSVCRSSRLDAAAHCINVVSFPGVAQVFHHAYLVDIMAYNYYVK